MIRYWADSESTGDAFLVDGWLRTGDVGRLETHNGVGKVVYLMGRVKDVVKTGGENVPAAELERTLMRHPGVSFTAVVGLPHQRLGEIVSAAVVLRDGWNWKGPQLQISLPSTSAGNRRMNSEMQQQSRSREMDLQLLQAHCRRCGLAGFKVPRVIAVVDALPLNATGKVKKLVLREELMKMYAKSDQIAQASKL
jgi:acyl-activating enzyme 14